MYGPQKLAHGAQLLTEWKASQRAADMALYNQKEATRFEAETRGDANKEAVSLSEMSRTLFAAEEPLLTLLGLTPIQETVTGPDGQPIGTEAARPSESAAETLARWRALFGNALALTGDPAARLAEVGVCSPTASSRSVAEADSARGDTGARDDTGLEQSTPTPSTLVPTPSLFEY